MSEIETAEEVREAVREIYARFAEDEIAGCGCSVDGCCDGGPAAAVNFRVVCYSPVELASVLEVPSLVSVSFRLGEIENLSVANDETVKLSRMLANG